MEEITLQDAVKFIEENWQPGIQLSRKGWAQADASWGIVLKALISKEQADQPENSPPPNPPSNINF